MTKLGLSLLNMTLEMSVLIHKKGDSLFCVVVCIPWTRLPRRKTKAKAGVWTIYPATDWQQQFVRAVFSSHNPCTWSKTRNSTMK